MSGRDDSSAAEIAYKRTRRFTEIRNITDPEAAFAQVKAMAEGLAA